MVVFEEWFGYVVVFVMSLVENVLLIGVVCKELIKNGFVNWVGVKVFVEDIIVKFDVCMSGFDCVVWVFLGGNL